MQDILNLLVFFQPFLLAQKGKTVRYWGPSSQGLVLHRLALISELST